MWFKKKRPPTTVFLGGTMRMTTGTNRDPQQLNKWRQLWQALTALVGRPRF